MFRTKQGTWILDDDDMYRIMILATEAAMRYGETGSTALLSQANRISQDIFDKLLEAGYIK